MFVTIGSSYSFDPRSPLCVSCSALIFPPFNLVHHCHHTTFCCHIRTFILLRYSSDNRSLGSKNSSSFPLDFAEPGSRLYSGVQPFSATEKFLEIVGPPNLARFVRSSLLCR